MKATTKLKGLIVAFFTLTMVLVGMVKAMCQTTNAGRIFTADSLPLTKPTSFSSSDFMYVRKDSTTWMWRLGWYRAPIRLSAKDGKDGPQGATGPQGPKGVDGICPNCPPSGGSSYRNVRYVTTLSELKQSMVDAQNLGYPSKIILANDIDFGNDSVALPQRAMMIEVDGSNTKITSNKTTFYRDTKDLATSETMIDFMPHFHHIKFVNTTGVGNAIRLSSTYVGKIEMCQFLGYYEALLLSRTMSMEVCNNRFWNGKSWYINLTYRNIAGGNSSTSQSNTSSIHDNCFRVDSLQIGAVLIEGASLTPFEHNAVEGGTKYHNGSDYGVVYDYAGSPNVKGADIPSNHFEVKFKLAAVKVRQNDGFIHYVKNYGQYENTELVIDNDGGYPQVNYHFQEYIVPLTKWSGNAIWDFIGLPSGAKETDAKMWVNGIIPFYRSSQGYGEGGTKYPYWRTSPKLKLNGVDY